MSNEPTDDLATYEQRCRILLPPDPPAWLVEDDQWWPIVAAVSSAGVFERVIQVLVSQDGTAVVCNVAPHGVITGAPTSGVLQAAVATPHAEVAVEELSTWLRGHMASPLSDPNILEEM